MEETAPNPAGYKHLESGPLAIVRSVDSDDLPHEPIEDIAEDVDLIVFALSRSHGLVGSRPGPFPFREITDLIERLRPCIGVLDLPEFHSSSSYRAELLMALSKAGVPTVANRIDSSTREIIGDALSDTLESAQVDDLLDPTARDRLSVLLRTRSAIGRKDTEPMVSILLATTRPEFLNHCLEQVRRQEYRNRELVLILHGDGFREALRETDAQDNHEITVVRASAETPFGAVLNQGLTVARGQLLAKMDDDDWYSPKHIGDLVEAMAYSGADLVGKGAEFVYLAELDITIRRMVEGMETYDNRNLAGGTLLTRRRPLEAIGGWRDIPRHVDKALLEDFHNAQRHWYRTHGFGYILNRRSAGHTWDAQVDYFLDHSVDQWRGLALDEALIEV